MDCGILSMVFNKRYAKTITSPNYNSGCFAASRTAPTTFPTIKTATFKVFPVQKQASWYSNQI